MLGVMFTKNMDAHKGSAIRKKYSSALMSNQKWKKFFSVMAEHGEDLCGLEYHFTDTKNILYGTAPLKNQVWDSAIDDPVEGAGGPIEYKHIEFIRIPFIYEYRKYEKGPLNKKEQNIKKFLIALNKVGKFPILEDEHGILINCYK